MTSGPAGRFRRPRALVPLPAPDFNLDLTLSCGQVFHWIKAAEGYLGMVGDVPAYVEQRGAELWVPRGIEGELWNYFGLGHPWEAIYQSFPSDAAMQEALRFCRGLRIIRQPLWECVATFITSSMKRVAHIAQMSHALRRRFGAPVSFGGTVLFAYPPPERLAHATERQLRACGLGFRAKNLRGAARLIAEGSVNLDEVQTLDDQAAVEELCRLPGVGEKVANCALLFGFGRFRAFPIDVWINRVLREIYFQKKRKVTPQRLRLFSQTYFGDFGGYAQQYLFHHARTGALQEPQSPTAVTAKR